MDTYKEIVERILDDRSAYLRDRISEGMLNGKQVSGLTKSKNSGHSTIAKATWFRIFELHEWYWCSLNDDIRGTNLMHKYATRDLGFAYGERSILASMIKYLEEGNDPYTDNEVKAMINGGNSLELHKTLTSNSI